MGELEFFPQLTGQRIVQTSLFLSSHNAALPNLHAIFFYCCAIAPQPTREFKQITTAGTTTAAVTEKVWGKYISEVCQILIFITKAIYRDERNMG